MDPLITEIAENDLNTAVDLLCRFFGEEGFPGDPETIRANLNALRNDRHHWAAVASINGQIEGVVTRDNDALCGMGPTRGGWRSLCATGIA